MATDAREARARRKADRQGLQLTKSRRRDPDAWDYGRYWLWKASANRQRENPVAGLPKHDGEGRLRFGLTLDEVEAYLSGQREEQSQP